MCELVTYAKRLTYNVLLIFIVGIVIGWFNSAIVVIYRASYCFIKGAAFELLSVSSIPQPMRDIDNNKHKIFLNTVHTSVRKII